jgi:hypothetical protein
MQTHRYWEAVGNFGCLSEGRGSHTRRDGADGFEHTRTRWGQSGIMQEDQGRWRSATEAEGRGLQYKHLNAGGGVGTDTPTLQKAEGSESHTCRTWGRWGQTHGGGRGSGGTPTCKPHRCWRRSGEHLPPAWWVLRVGMTYSKVGADGDEHTLKTRTVGTHTCKHTDTGRVGSDTLHHQKAGASGGKHIYLNAERVGTDTTPEWRQWGSYLA